MNNSTFNKFIKILLPVFIFYMSLTISEYISLLIYAKLNHIKYSDISVLINKPNITIVISFVSKIITLIIFASYYIRNNTKTSVKKLLDRKIILYITITALFGILFNYLVNIIDIVRMDKRYIESVNAFNSQPIPIIILSALVVSPLLEEIVYRGVFFQVIKDNLNTTYAIIISSILFAVIHNNVTQVTYALIAGLYLGYVRNKYESVIIPIFMHVLLNGIALAFSYII